MKHSFIEHIARKLKTMGNSSANNVYIGWRDDGSLDAHIKDPKNDTIVKSFTTHKSGGALLIISICHMSVYYDVWKSFRETNLQNLKKGKQFHWSYALSKV
jgi:hypothetical protein